MPKKEKNNESIDNIIENTFSQIKNIVDANTVVGEVIKITDNIMIVPISKISVGLVSGGILPKSKKDMGGAGSGTGFNIEPIGFVSINNGVLEFSPITTSSDLGMGLMESIIKIYDRYLEKSEKDKYEKE